MRKSFTKLISFASLKSLLGNIYFKKLKNKASEKYHRYNLKIVMYDIVEFVNFKSNMIKNVTKK